jgi:ketosteroid isomerase-like protein
MIVRANFYKGHRWPFVVGGWPKLLVLIILSVCVARGRYSFAQASSSDSTGFAGLDNWKKAVLAGDAAGLKTLYSSDPAAQISVNGVTGGADSDVSFWLGLKAKSMKLEIVRLKERTNGESVIFKAEVQTADGRTIDITDAQGWRKQGDQWRLVGAERTDAPHLQQPSDMNKNIYPPDADARAEIKEAEEKAAVRHQRVLLVFGANWCYDCHVLDLALHRPDFQQVMTGYEVVHVDIGDDGKKNNDLAQQFDVPLNKGVPSLAVVSSDGTLVVSQKNGEFEDARAMTPEAMLAFLNQWKPGAR